jgi:acetoin utilization deacetylase AcuC-like enzyme
MSSTIVFYDAIYLDHDTGFGHPERAERLEATLQALRESGLSEKVRIMSPRDATEEEIGLVHPKKHIQRVKEMAASGGGWLDGDTPVSPRSFEAALRSAGANLDGLERIFSGDAENVFCLARPPGHHALAMRGMGFCLFNNNAIAARFAVRKFGLERIFILDWDAHHGNGLQDIFYDDRQVLYVSLHQYPHYPGTGGYGEVGGGQGEGYIVNFPLPPRCGGDVYLAAFDEVIMPIARQFEPQLVLISAGYDGHFSDPLCSMSLTSTDFADMTGRLKDLAGEFCSGRMLASLEGGYSLPGIAASISNTIAVMAGEEVRLVEDVEPRHDLISTQRGMEVVEATKSALSPYWSL